MLDPSAIPAVDDGEVLNRFLFQSSLFRSSDDGIKPAAFLPSPRVELSVTRQRDARSDEIWNLARQIAEGMGKTLYGLCRIAAGDCRLGPLSVEARPLPTNPNHADVVGWPPNKEDQKEWAVLLASRAGPLAVPPVEGELVRSPSSV